VYAWCTRVTSMNLDNSIFTKKKLFYASLNYSFYFFISPFLSAVNLYYRQAMFM
jgi:hypothetical protein